MQRPEFSVVIPARNAARTLPEQLAALTEQECSLPWEILVVDNGSTDGTRQVVLERALACPEIRLVDGSVRKGSAYARNRGVGAARGSLLGFVDADDVVGHGWVGSMSASLTINPFVAGRVETKRLNDPNHAASRGIDVAAPPTPRLMPYRMSRRTWGPPTLAHGYLPYAMSCNMGVRRELFDRVGGFDVRYATAEDVELSWRIQLTGRPLHFEPGALVHYRLPSTALAVGRQQFAQSQGPLLYRNFQRAGMPTSGVRGALYDYATLAVHVRDVFRPEWRYLWAITCGHRLGRLVNSLRYRRVFL